MGHNLQLPREIKSRLCICFDWIHGQSSFQPRIPIDCLAEMEQLCRMYRKIVKSEELNKHT